MTTTDTPRWTVTKFNSALLEHDGETCNEIFCISRDEAECLVDLLNELTERAEKAEADVEGLRNGMQGSCYCCEPVGILNQKLEAEIERLKVINADMRNFLSKAIHNEGFNEEQALKFIYQ